MEPSAPADIQRAEEALEQLENEIGLTFRDKKLLLQAFVHASFVNEHRDLGLNSSERLEFLGDAVVGLITASHYYGKGLGTPQELTDLRKQKVSEAFLSKAAEGMGLGRYLVLGRTELVGHGRVKPRLLADCFEALTGAIFLDQGYAAAESFVFNNLIARSE